MKYSPISGCFVDDKNKPIRKPSKPKIVQWICDQVAKGKSLHDVLPEEDEKRGLPNIVTFSTWKAEDKELKKIFINATEVRKDSLREKAVQLIDKLSKAGDKEEASIAKDFIAAVDRLTKQDDNAIVEFNYYSPFEENFWHQDSEFDEKAKLIKPV